ASLAAGGVLAHEPAPPSAGAWRRPRRTRRPAGGRGGRRRGGWAWRGLSPGGGVRRGRGGGPAEGARAANAPRRIRTSGPLLRRQLLQILWAGLQSVLVSPAGNDSQLLYPADSQLL